MTSETETSAPWRVGVHTSIAGSFDQAAERAHRIGCTSFQIFVSSPRMWRSRDPRPEEISAMAALRARYDLSPLVVHASYLINLASPDAELRAKSIEAFRGEVAKSAALGAEYLVLHPGSFREGSRENGIRTMTESVREAARLTPFGKVTLLVENTCGQGNTLGGTFEELRDILALLDGLPVGCCIDTCHTYAAGMDISSEYGLAAIVESLKKTVTLGSVKVIHTNDSRSALGSHLDRHEHIGKGFIGLDGLRRVVNHPALRDKAFILETPVGEEGDDRRNLEAIRRLREGDAVPRKAASKIAAARRTKPAKSKAGPSLRSG